MYPEFVDNPVRIGKSMIFIQKAITIKEASISPTLLKQDRDGYLAQLLSLDYGCTNPFILNFDHVKEKAKFSGKLSPKIPLLKHRFGPLFKPQFLFDGVSYSSSSNPINK